MLAAIVRYWDALHARPGWQRRSIKAVTLAVVWFLVLYPYPHLFVRHVRHLCRLDALADPRDPEVRRLLPKLESYVEQIQPPNDREMLNAVQRFVCQEIPYAWDWEVWGVADYFPTVAEVLAVGREDCDGRAILAAALLRARGVDARLVGDPRHLWVQTPMGATMSPLGEPAFHVSERGIRVEWARLLDIGPVGFGIAVFPLTREAIILLAVWLALLPRRFTVPNAGLCLMSLVAGLMVVRWAGSDPQAPRYAGILLGFGVLACGVFFAKGSKVQKSNKKTDRSVC